VAAVRRLQLTPDERETVRRVWAWSTDVSSAPDDSIHGPSHWRRVGRLGMRIAGIEGGDLLVVALFAACHDIARVHDGIDNEHGPNAVARMHAELPHDLGLSPRQFDLLYRAITSHTEGETVEDPTIGACWDADRLDLVRIGFDIDPRRLSTATARAPALQSTARRLWERDRRFRIAAGLWVPRPIPPRGEP
jgi:uncharacterized protein